MNIYMYPIENPKKSATHNPYIQKTVDALIANGHTVINNGKVTPLGVIDMLCSFFKTDIFFLNWIEDLSDKRFGYLQNILFFIILVLIKLFKKKIIWIMHNKISHSKKNRLLKIINFYLLTNYSDIVITHSQEGIRFGKSFLNKDKELIFKHHPMNILQNTTDRFTKEYDLLIWGSIAPHKGIAEFLEIYKSSTLKKYRLCIVGKITNLELKNTIESYRSETITILNQFLSDADLDSLIHKSQIVLFTYAGYSTLSSGALMHSLERKCSIIGPKVGAFEDLAKENIILAYDTIHDLPMLVEKSLETFSHPKDIANFIEQNSWGTYGRSISNLLEQL